MKILKLLNKKYLPIFIICFLSLSLNLKAEDEPVDIWDLGKELEQNSSNVKNENSDIDEIKIDSVSTQTGNTINKINSNVLGASKINIVGLYDPEDNGLNIDMWSKSNGSEIKLILDKLNKMNLSKDSKEILDITLLTNSYFPSENITEEDFIDYKLKYLIKNNDKKLIKSYLIKNEKNIYNSKLIKFYIDDHIENSDLEKACKIFDEIKYFSDDYINKFKIYCLIDQGKREEAQLLYDLNKEFGFKDDFYEKKFNFLMGYNEKEDENISDKNILNFHLSHRTNNNFSYQPNEKSPKFIWKYLSSSNLLENINEINLEDIEKISLIEKATHEQNYEEKELFELYKRFQFNINQLLNVKDSYKLLKKHEGRALLYQRLILTEDEIQILDLSYKLKESFIKDNIENAFSSELKRVLLKVSPEQVPSNFSSFYNDNLTIPVIKEKKIKVNNKIIHQSKLLKYFEDNYDIEKVEEDLNKLLKSIKKNKDYNISNKDLILLESLISDGVKIKKNYKNMFNFNQSNIPTDIQLLINNNEVGMVLLRLVEIIGEDELENLDSDTLYFMSTILNQLNLDSVRNKILLKVLPLKI
tara:strand:+ start:166 stop:1923 length:1758 start_codon:yes stop_codon:yes gene_type:complete